jgi:DNA-binding NtrC family response regulator
MLVLIVDDHRSARRTLLSILEEFDGVNAVEASSLDEARRALERHPIDLALIDVCLSEDSRNRDGLTLVREVASKTVAVPVCVTASSDMEVIRTAMRNGAYDYLLKGDLCVEVLTPIVTGLRERRRLEREVAELRARVAPGAAPPGLIGTSPAIERLRKLIQRVALSDRPVLVLGPNGSGKEVVARAIHALGPHPDAPLLDVNCGAIPANLVESLLFGHERGAFTGAERRLGYFSVVGRGTLLLDEIAEVPLEQQAAFLRVLETRRFRPIGAHADVAFEGRIVAATHANLQERVAQGRFREDLFHRLDVLTITVPQLDDHREDIPALVAWLLRDERRRLQFSQDALDWLTMQSWPGNVRQLRNLLDRVAVFAEADEVTAATLVDVSGRAGDSAEAALRRAIRTILHLPMSQDKLKVTQAALVHEAMALADGNKSAAARLLNSHRRVVERVLLRGSSDPDDEEGGSE